MDSLLSAEELERYSRQIGPGVLDEQGQARLKQSTVLISRVGGMGGPAALMLAMAGVGRIIIAHGGEMISPDLNRQVLGNENVLGKKRAPFFGEYIREMNRFVEVEALDYEPDEHQANEIAKRCDLIVSCPPTFTERLRLNSAAVNAGIPFIDAAQWGMNGSLVVCRPSTPCLRCLYPEEPPFEELFPVVGAISSMIGSLAALEGIKILSGCGSPMWGKLFYHDGFAGKTNYIQLTKNPNCQVCGNVTANC